MICADHQILFGDQSRKDWAGYLGRVERKRNAHKVFVRKAE